MNACVNCRGTFDSDTSTSQDPERFCASQCEDQHWGFYTDPDELGTFGEVLDHWTRRGGPTADERTRFWMSWTRHTLAWTFAVAGCLIVRSMYGGLVDTIVTAIGAVAIVALVWQAVDAVRFVIEGRRWKR